MVNATMTAQELVDRLTLKQIIFSGIAGGRESGTQRRRRDDSRPVGTVSGTGVSRANDQRWDTQWRGIRPAPFSPTTAMMFPRQVLVTRQGGPADKTIARDSGSRVYKKYLDTARRGGKPRSNSRVAPAKGDFCLKN